MTEPAPAIPSTRGIRVLRTPDIPVGAREAFSKTITAADLAFYGGISGDFNPLHVNEEFARTTDIGGRLVYELVVAALVSTVLGRVVGPGFRCQRHALDFPRPVRVGDTITAMAEVVESASGRGSVTCRTECRNQRGEVVLDGRAELISVVPSGS